MLLKDHKDFPKKKEVNLIPLKQGEVVVGFYEKNDKDQEVGFNKALNICGEIEVLERLDFTIFKSLVSDIICKIVVFCNAKISEEALNDLANTYTDKALQKFGTPKIDEGKIEKIILENGYDIGGCGLGVNSKDLAKAIAKEMRGD